MGGVACSETMGSDEIQKFVGGRMFNLHSKNDQVLGMLLKTVDLKSTVGRTAIKGVKSCNIDCSDFINSHLSYFDNIDEVLKRVKQEEYKQS